MYYYHIFSLSLTYLAMTIPVMARYIQILRTYAEAMKLPEAAEWDACTWKEYQSLVDQKVFEVVRPPKGAEIISGKLVYKTKEHPDGTLKKFKARVVARGFLQKRGIHFQELWAGVANVSSVRTLLALMALLRLTRRQIDIMTAFLYSFLDEVVYLKPPLLFRLPLEYVWKLIKALYSLV